MGSEGNELLHVSSRGVRATLKIGYLGQRPPETRLDLLSLDALVPRETKSVGSVYWRKT
jgi:hypothetical protein